MSTGLLSGLVQGRKPLVQTIGDGFNSQEFGHGRHVRAPERELNNKSVDPLPGCYRRAISNEPINNLIDLLFNLWRWDLHAATIPIEIAPPGVTLHFAQPGER